MRQTLAAIHFATLVGMAAPLAAQSGNTTIVYDVSGSMWGQIDGVAKVTIAREVLGDILDNWPAGRNLGLIAYGHRREGDCSDIEQVVPLGPLDAAAMRAQINALVPRGRTPLTESVRMAAESMRYQDEPATVILVTDGLETCNADPCALAGELARAGIDFTAHVVGFDIAESDRAQVACIAEATGGIFVPADSAQELSDALQQVTMIEPAALGVTLRAVDARSGAPLAGADWQVSGADAAPQTATGTALMSLALDPGTYQIAATAPGFAGGMELTLDAQTAGTIDVPLDKVMATLVLRAVDAQTGLPIMGVDWSLMNVATEADVSQTASDDSLAVLVEPGDYRVTAAHQGRSGSESISASLDQDREIVIELAESLPDASVQTEAEIAAGSVFEVAWSGPDDRQDYITIVPVGAPEDDYGDYARTNRGSPARVTAPDALGAHEVRYVQHENRRVLASQPVTLIPVSAALDAPETATAGSVVEVQWQGPDNPQDYITVVEVGAPEGSYTDYWRTNRGSPARVTMPDALGNHELRYVLHQSGRTLASRPITLDAVSAQLLAPSELPAGSVVEVQWQGPDNPQDYITVVEVGAPEGSYTDYWRTNRGSPARVTVPDALGNFELRYVLHQSGRTLASLPVTLTAVTASLDAPETIVPGGKFQVAWQGPNNPQDYITIVERGAAEGAYTDYWRTSRGSPAQLNAPAEAGEYELRYVIHRSGRTLSSVPVTVGAGEVGLTVLGEVSAGGVVTIEWAGPGRYEDFIQIVASDAPDDASALREARASQGSPVQLFAPPAAGLYELRYRASDSGEVLARIPLQVQ